MSSQGGNSVDNNFLKENQDLKRRLSEIETKYENLKAEAKIISNESKSLVIDINMTIKQLIFSQP